MEIKQKNFNEIHYLIINTMDTNSEKLLNCTDEIMKNQILKECASLFETQIDVIQLTQNTYVLEELEQFLWPKVMKYVEERCQLHFHTNHTYQNYYDRQSLMKVVLGTLLDEKINELSTNKKRKLNS
jgi:hypothetical protein